MKHLRETFTDQEFKQLQAIKKLSGKNWHDFIMMKVPEVVFLIEYPVAESDLTYIVSFAKERRPNKISVALKEVKT